MGFDGTSAHLSFSGIILMTTAPNPYNYPQKLDRVIISETWRKKKPLSFSFFKSHE